MMRDNSARTIEVLNTELASSAPSLRPAGIVALVRDTGLKLMAEPPVGIPVDWLPETSWPIRIRQSSVPVNALHGLELNQEA